MSSVRCTTSALVIRDLPMGADTGNRMVRDQTARSHGVSHDGDWLFVDAPQGRGWASSRFLTAVPDTPVSKWVAVPHGLVALRETFGDPAPIPASGAAPPGWATRVTAGRVALPGALPFGWAPATVVRSVSCHPLIADPLGSAFDEIHRRGLWYLLRTFDGCYNWRNARGLSKLSTHCWAISIDLNAAWNGLGATPTIDGRIVGIFEDRGFLWGGRWSRPDGMHFQYVTGY
jgi:hypothetical protein